VVLLQDSGRRLETANEALGELAALQDELTVRSGSTARAVGQVVANWVGLFRAEIASLEGAVEALRDIENPFTFGNPVQARDTGLFTGRRDIVLEIERNLLRSAQTPTLLLYGQRRMGKTSILNQLPTLLGPRFLPVTVDCQTPQMAESQPAMLRYVSRCLANSLNLRLRAASASNASEAELAPISLTDLREDAYSHFEDWLDGFEARLPADARLLLCLDEFERLQSAVDAGWGLHFLDSLRHWAQHRPRFAVMFIGSHTFEQLGAAWTDRFLSARRLRVSFLSDEDCRRLLTRPTSTFKLVYEPEAIAGIIRQTHGQPYLTQALASELVHYLNGERRKMANAGDIEIAVAKALDASGEYFADLWFGRTNDERRILSEIAAGVASASENPTIRTLRDYDILDESGDYAVPMVKRWVLAQNVWT
jgi:hypothetical protein